MRNQTPEPGESGRDGRCLISREADASAELASRQVREFVHELSNLVDGSLRSIDLARRDLAPLVQMQEALLEAQKHMDTAAMAVGHMASLIRSIHHPLHGIGFPGGASRFDRARPLEEAVRHAVEVMGPLATERCIGVSVELDPGTERTPAAPLYPVIANALRNAIDSVNHDGQIDIVARIEGGAREGHDHVVIEVIDDGSGPPAGSEERVFEFGFSTKPGSSGIGLALARDVVTELGGTISLRPRWSDDKPRRGAVLTVRLPLGERSARREKAR